jgi:hypothetical protein
VDTTSTFEATRRPKPSPRTDARPQAVVPIDPRQVEVLGADYQREYAGNAPVQLPRLPRRGLQRPSGGQVEASTSCAPEDATRGLRAGNELDGKKRHAEATHMGLVKCCKQPQQLRRRATRKPNPSPGEAPEDLGGSFWTVKSPRVLPPSLAPICGAPRDCGLAQQQASGIVQPRHLVVVGLGTRA